MFSLGAIAVITSDHVGERVQIRFPKPTVKRYKQRTARRYAREPRNWITRGKGEYFLLDGGRTLLCHPDDVPTLRQQLAGLQVGGCGTVTPTFAGF